MNPQDELIRDTVAFASASTYYSSRTLGIRVTVNTSWDKSRYVNTVTGPMWPSVVVWIEPNQKAIVIEEVETVSTSGPESLVKWRLYSQLDVTFNLIVPLSEAARVRRILNAANINVTRLQTWIYSTTTRSFQFGDA